MCGIAGLIHRGRSSDVGSEMTAMLLALKHRGPDSTGFAVYGEPSEGDYIRAADEVVQRGLPGEMYRLFHEYKWDEWERFMHTVTEWDTDTYMECLP